MNREEYRNSAYDMLYLISCLINNRMPSSTKIEYLEITKLFNVANFHSLSAITAYALEAAGIYEKKFEEEKFRSLRKNILCLEESKKISARLENSNIWYVRLKGAILQEYYPNISMRQMADNDILFDKHYRSEVKHIMNELGYKTISYGKGNHDIYQKPPFYNFEMHTMLFTETFNEKFSQYYENVKHKFVQNEKKGYEYKLSNEDFYIYMTAHEYKHFSLGGTGLRSLIDAYVFLYRFFDCLDMVYIEKELKLLGIYEYEVKRRQLVIDIFKKGRINSYQKRFLDNYIFSGTYGNVENSVRNAIDKSVLSRLKYIKQRLFPTLPMIKYSYPFFYTHKYLIPILYIYRLYLMVTKSRKKVLSEIKALLRI